MRQLGSAARLGRHLFCLWRAGQLRFRLETFGLYYPSPPYSAPWWRISLRGLAHLARQTGSYARWLEEMDCLRREGPPGWWERAYPHRDLADSWWGARRSVNRIRINPQCRR